MVKLQKILLGLTVYFYSIFINALFFCYLLIKGVYRKGPLALVKFFLPSKLPKFDEEKFREYTKKLVKSRSFILIFLVKDHGIDFKSGFIETEKDVKIHFMQTGKVDSHRLILLIHGFPEFW